MSPSTRLSNWQTVLLELFARHRKFEYYPEGYPKQGSLADFRQAALLFSFGSVLRLANFSAVLLAPGHRTRSMGHLVKGGVGRYSLEGGIGRL